MERPHVCFLTTAPSELPADSQRQFHTCELKSFQMAPAVRFPFRPFQLRVVKR